MARSPNRLRKTIAFILLVFVPASIAQDFILKSISEPNDNSKQVFLNSIPATLKTDFRVVEKIGDDWKQSSLFFLYAKKGLLPDKAANVADFLNHPSDHLLLLEKKQFEACREKHALVPIFTNTEWILLAKKTARSDLHLPGEERRI